MRRLLPLLLLLLSACVAGVATPPLSCGAGADEDALAALRAKAGAEDAVAYVTRLRRELHQMPEARRRAAVWHLPACTL